MERCLELKPATNGKMSCVRALKRERVMNFNGGEDRIRTCGTLNRYNRLAGGPNQPLWHLSITGIQLLKRLRRRGQDSNLRYGRPYNGFQDHRLKPLGHLSNV